MLRPLLLFLLCCGALALLSADASAAITHDFESSITGTEPLAPFTDPWGLALDSAGNLYVADAEGPEAPEHAGAVDIFSPLNIFQPPQLNDASVGATPFTGPYVRSVTVDNLPGPNQGTVYVAESNLEYVDVFKPEGGGKYKLLQERKFSGFMSVAFDNSSGPNSRKLYVFGEGRVALVTLNADGTLPLPKPEEEPAVIPLQAPQEGFGNGNLAVGPTGKVYLADPEHGLVDVYSNGDVLEEATITAPAGAKSFEPVAVGVDPSNGEVYVADAANHLVDEFSGERKYLGQITQTEVVPGEPAPLKEPLGVAINASGDVYISDGAAKTVDVFGPDIKPPPLAPTIDSATATGVTETSADLNAQIDPNGVDTTYHFEYGTSTAYGTSVPIPEGDLGEGTEGISVTQHLAGLSPNTTYHWRVVATSLGGTTTGVDHTFVETIPAPETGCPDEQARVQRDSTSLPDCRAYELVTPPKKNGSLIGAVFGEAPHVASDGQRVTAQSLQCFAAPESCTVLRSSEARLGSTYEFARTADGWVTNSLAPPVGFEPLALWGVSADGGTALYSAPSPPEGQDDFYARRADGSTVQIGPFGENAVAESRRGEGERANDRAIARTGVIATADLSHVVYETNPPLWSFDPSGQSSLYEYVVGAEKSSPLMVGVSGGLNSHVPISTCGTGLGTALEAATKLYGSLSEDGRIVYFSAEEGRAAGCPPATELYARVDGELPDARSTLISAPTPGVCESKGCLENTGTEKELERFRSAQFEGASADGSRVFFTNAQQLTDGASELSGNATLGCNTAFAPGGCNLYESECEHCDELTGERELAKRHLVDVSEGAKEAGGPGVQGVLAISADGSHVYFVAKGVLTNEANATRAKPVNEADNLYVYSEGHVAFITTLSSADSPQWELGAHHFTADVTPDGRFLVFPSHRALTPDDTRTEDPAPAQLFEYDALTRTLVRLSIGAHGYDDNGNEGLGDASSVPASTAVESGTVPMRSDPTMSDDGQFVFFQSPIALTPGAVNDAPVGEANDVTTYAQNVYEYHDGQVYLISDGSDTSPNPSTFSIPAVELLGSDTSGLNVFFTTFARLVPEDTDTQRDFYDAHVCTEAQPCTSPTRMPPAPCEGESCHGISSGQGAGETPASESFTGPGNLAPAAPRSSTSRTAAQIRAEKLAKALKACRRDKKKRKRATCEKQARKRYATVAKTRRAQRASNKRRTRA